MLAFLIFSQRLNRVTKLFNKYLCRAAALLTIQDGSSSGSSSTNQPWPNLENHRHSAVYGNKAKETVMPKQLVERLEMVATVALWLPGPLIKGNVWSSSCASGRMHYLGTTPWITSWGSVQQGVLAWYEEILGSMRTKILGSGALYQFPRPPT